MKKILFVMLMMFTVSIFAQSTTHVLVADSISNDIEKTGYLDLDMFSPNTVDEVYISLACSGEIDIDSVEVYGGIKTGKFWYQGANVEDIIWNSSVIGVEGTIAVNLADGVEGVSVAIPALTEALLKGYNMIKVVVIGAAAGNDATDTAQKVVVIARVHTTAGS